MTRVIMMCAVLLAFVSTTASADERFIPLKSGESVVIDGFVGQSLKPGKNATVEGLEDQSIDIKPDTPRRKVANPPLPAPRPAQVFPNGYMDGEDFLWTGGGEDPLRISLKEALAIPRLNLPKDVQERFLRAVQSAPEGHDAYTLRHGDKLGGAMVSGPGSIAMNPKAMTDEWKVGRSRVVRVWWIRDAEGREWRFMIPEVCKNLLIERMEAPVPCVCVPEKGDACIPATS